MTTLFIFEAESCKNFKAIFLETLFFKSSTSNAYISETFALRRLGEVPIDPKFNLVSEFGRNSIPQTWDFLDGCTQINVSVVYSCISEGTIIVSVYQRVYQLNELFHNAYKIFKRKFSEKV